jgi:hypothetical protein
MSAYIDNLVGDPYTTQDADGIAQPPDSGSAMFGSGSFVDLLREGIGHYASYRMATRAPAMGQPEYANRQVAAPSTQVRNQELMRWALIGGGVFLAVLVIGRMLK